MESLMLCFPALNQIYYTKNSFVNYSDLFNHFLLNIVKKVANNHNSQNNIVDKLKLMFLDQKIKFESLVMFEDLILKQIATLLKEFSIEANIEKFFFDDLLIFDSPITLYFIEDYLKEFSSKAIKLIINQDELYKIFLDFKILQSLKLSQYFSYFLDNDLLNISKGNPENLLVLGYDVSKLVPYNEINCHIGVLCNMLLSGLEFNPEFSKIVETNLKIIREKKINISFFASTFFQQKYIIEALLLNNKLNVHKFIDMHFKVLVVMKSSFKLDLFKRNRFILSNEKAIYQPYFGGKDLQGKFNTILVRFNMMSDFIVYKDIIEGISKIKESDKSVTIIDDLENIDCFLQRDKMMNFLKTFHESKQIQVIQRDYNATLNFPKQLILPIKDLLSEEYFKKLIYEQKIDLPFLIKFKVECKKMSHSMILVISSKNLADVINRLRDINNEHQDVTCVLQNFINHGGYIAKLYRFNNQVLINFRPSIPDMHPDYVDKIDTFKTGFWEYMTDTLGSSTYKEFWMKFDNDTEIPKKANMKLMEEVSKLFETYSKKTLFGLDFIFDLKNNNYSLIDCNYFPGYKEIEKEFGKHLTEHINYYHSKNK